MKIWHSHTLGDEVPGAQAAFHSSPRSRGRGGEVWGHAGLLQVPYWKEVSMGKRDSATAVLSVVASVPWNIRKRC